MSDRQKLFYALVVSLLFHLAIGYILASWSELHPGDVAKRRPDLSQLTVTIMPQRPTPVPGLAAAPTPLPAHMVRPVLDSDGLTRSSTPPPHALFQSDSNMVAGSLLPATGNIPLPSEAGPNRKFTDFADIPASIGKGETPSEAMRARQAAQNAQSMPLRTPNAITQVQRSPAPAPTPRPVPSPAADTLALGKPTPTPVAELARLTLRGHADMAPMTRPSESHPAPPTPPSPSLPEPSTQRRTERTRIDGGITAPGPPAVDAVETPFGRYHRKLSNLIGSRWQLYLQEHPKDVGDVTILVKLDTSGKVSATRVIANHSMDDLAELSTRAIMESDLPPVPDDLAPMLRDGKLEITFNFNVYDPNNDSPGR